MFMLTHETGMRMLVVDPMNRTEPIQSTRPSCSDNDLELVWCNFKKKNTIT